MLFRTRRLFLASFLVSTLLTFALIGSALAANGIASIYLEDIVFNGCQGTEISGSFRIIATDSGGVVVNDVTPADVTLQFSAPEGSPAPLNVLVDSSTKPFLINFPATLTSYVTLVISQTSDAGVVSPTYQFNCSGSVCTVGTCGATTNDDDGRINRRMGDLIDALYVRTDSEGKPSLHVYSINDDSLGTYMGMFAYSDFAAYLSEAPAVNTKIKTVDKSTLYALATGEFQINIGPDAEGKITSLIFRGIPPRGLYHYVVKP